MARAFTAGVLIMSDKGSQGLRQDQSGRMAVEILEAAGFAVVKTKIIPDDQPTIIETLTAWADKERLNLIVTSGGTGLSPRDVTPQAMKAVIEYEVPGMAEAMRAESLKKTSHAMISRAMVGVRKSTLIVNLPGSPKGVQENLAVILPALPHALAKLLGDQDDCAR